MYSGARSVAPVSMKTTTRRRTDWLDWEKVDWSLRNCELCEQLCVSHSIVHRRRLRAPESPNRLKHRVKRKFTTSVSRVDWKKPDSVIAAEKGLHKRAAAMKE